MSGDRRERLLLQRPGHFERGGGRLLRRVALLVPIVSAPPLYGLSRRGQVRLDHDRELASVQVASLAHCSGCGVSPFPVVFWAQHYRQRG